MMCSVESWNLLNTVSESFKSAYFAKSSGPCLKSVTCLTVNRIVSSESYLLSIPAGMHVKTRSVLYNYTYQGVAMVE
jgi:hypothetical protein